MEKTTPTINPATDKVVVDFLNRKYRGKLVDNKETTELTRHILAEFYEESAAPDMYEALKELTKIVRNAGHELWISHSGADAALSKAEGK